MKKAFLIILSLIMIHALSACENAKNADISSNASQSAASDNTDSSRLLIAYFSVPENVDATDAVAGASIVVKDGEKLGNTEYVANIIAQTTGGDLFRIETAEDYPLEHDALVDQAAEEQREQKRPALSGHVENFERYDTVILGFPNWWSDLPMPVYTFLEEYDFGAKTIIPFVTHGGSGFSSILNTISQLEPGAHVSDNTLSLSRNDVAQSEQQVVEWAESLGIKNSEDTAQDVSGTVLNTAADAHKKQTLYLWEEGNMPTVTEYTENNGNYADDPDFRPYLVSFPVPSGTAVKGAVLINAGGAFQYRSDQNEGTPVAEQLSSLGYQSFVVNYRLRPYTQQEGALDLARAVRFVRKNAEIYGIDEKDIAVMGFSAGGILAGEMLLNYDGHINGTALDQDYKPDELDLISADASADGMIYSFYGQLSIASTDTEKFASSDLPPTYFCYGTCDPFVNEFEECIVALKKAGVAVQVNVLNDRPHGYGYQEGWIPDFDNWLSDVFENN